MWVPWRPSLLPNILSNTIKPPESCVAVAVAVTNKFQRRSPPQTIEDDNDPNQNIGGLGQAVLTSLESEKKTSSSSSIRKPKQKQSGRDLTLKVSGSDVLLALQRATDQKIIKRKKKRDFSSSSNSTTAKTTESEDCLDYSQVRPLSIRSDWGSRLDELQSRLQDDFFIHTPLDC